MRTIWIIPAMLLLAIAGLASARAEQLHLRHDGIDILAEILTEEEIGGVRVTPAEEAVEVIRAAVDRLAGMSTLISTRIQALATAGDVVIVYDGRLPDATWSDINLASYIPRYYDPATGERRFVIAIGRTGIQWDPDIVSAVLAHEMAGHAFQHFEGRLFDLRLLDAECEAYLIQEQAMQDLGADKTTVEAVALRQALENHWCSDFRSFTRNHAPGVHETWMRRDPDVSRLLDAFREYLATGAS